MTPSRGIRLSLGLLAWFALDTEAASQGPDVLFLNSYHQGLHWSDQLVAGVRSSLHPHEQIFVEYLDSKRVESPRGDSLLAAVFEHKYRHRQPRVILSADDYALRFLFAWRDSLFPGVPVVFCGINNFKPSMLEGRHGYTGLGEFNRLVETVAMIPRILPEVTDLWFVTEHSATGTANRIRLDSLASANHSGQRFHFLDSAGAPSWAEVARLLSLLGPRDAVYWSELYKDRDGMYIDPEQDFGPLVQSVSVPVFAHQQQFVDLGALGGICNRGREHGLQAARLMRQVLEGADPDTLPVEVDSSVATTFRWDALRRFGIARERLPEGSLVLGAPVPVWKAYPVPTAWAIAGIVLLAAMASGLFVALEKVRRSRAALRISESALRSSEDSLRKLFDSLDDAVLVHRDDGVVEFINRGGLTMYGLREQDLPGLDVRALSAPEALVGFDLESRLQRAGNGDRLVFEWKARRPVREENFDAEVSLTPLVVEGRKRIVAVVRDVTERTAARRILLASKQDLELQIAERTRDLVQSNKELEAFAYSVSHDLRAPLRSVNGFAQALQEDLAPTLLPEHLDYLRRIRSASNRMGEIIDDLLHLSRITTSGLQRVPLDMDALVREVIQALDNPESNLEWVVGDLRHAIADPFLLTPLWTNLLSNAVKYSAKSASPRIEIGTLAERGATIWFVRDNGAGFDMAHAHHLFQPFRRLHHPDEFAGTGIGLAIVQRIVSRHGGRVWAEAELRKGATFFFTLG